jgi:CPA1 family monovalent cation:H+ antiporter
MRMAALLALAMVVAIATRRLALPYTVGLVLVGVAIALARVGIETPLTHDFIFNVILPPLLFEAALRLRWAELRADGGILLALTTLGTVGAAGVVALGAVVLMHWPLANACVFGALIAATDPVAVIAMFKDNRVGGRLPALMESESLFNDATAAILFLIAVSVFFDAAAPPPEAIVWRLGYVIAGGVAIGAACGGASLLIVGQTKEHVIEIATTVLAAYGAFLLAEKTGASGILATVTAGLVIGNVGVLAKGSVMSQRAKIFAVEFWDFAAFLANSAVFPLIGVAIGGAAFDFRLVPQLSLAVALVLAGRAVTVYPLSFAFSRSRQRVPAAHQHILWWGGLRGALALALALALPPTLVDKPAIILATFAVVAFSILVQGLTMPMLLKRLGVVGDQAASIPPKRLPPKER